MQLGPTFAEELRVAGLLGLPFSWGSDGIIEGRERLTDVQNAMLDAVLSAHNPTKARVPPSIKMWQAKAALAAAGKLAEAEAKILASGNSALQLAWEYAPDLSRTSPGVGLIGSAIGLDDAAIDSLFIAADAINV